jgi:hypothetical protein
MANRFGLFFGEYDYPQERDAETGLDHDPHKAQITAGDSKIEVLILPKLLDLIKNPPIAPNPSSSAEGPCLRRFEVAVVGTATYLATPTHNRTVA